MKQREDQATSFDLTGRTGSYMYMAPEVLLGQPYNDKVCRLLLHTACLRSAAASPKAHAAYCI